MARRLSLDLGSNSIGWVIFEVGHDDWPSKILDSGVRLFSNSRNAKTNVPLSVERRMARGARRRRDRYLQRKRGLVSLLRERGYLPVATANTQFTCANPYQLRHEGLTRELNKEELSRVLLHLCQRRGFLSNRKDQNKTEGGKTFGEMIAELQREMDMSGAKTLGSFFYTQCFSKGERTRMGGTRGWYPTRNMYKAEFASLREAQAPYHKELSEKDWEVIYKRLFFQRPLKKQSPGKCLFETDKERAYTALPSFQRFRTLQQLANLKIILPGEPAVAISKEQRDVLLDKLLGKKTLSYEEARKLLNLPKEAFFNIEVGSGSFRAAKHLFGDSTSALLKGKKYFGNLWLGLSEEKMNEVVLRILDTQDEKELKSYLISFELPDENLVNILSLSEENFERGYGRFCLEVLEGLSAYLQDNHGATYDEAVAALGFHHSDFREELRKFLPYYGEVLRASTRDFPDSVVPEEKRYGKIANPSVHVALNQLRKLVNAIIRNYGELDQVIVEVARDLPLGEQGLRDLAAEVKKNEAMNDRWAAKLAEYGLPNSFRNRRLLRLWEELGEQPMARRCPYSGEIIGIEKLFSAVVEVDHILPKSRTFTNHHSNLILCSARANKFKGDRSPYEAFTSADSPYDYQEILGRITALPLGKQRKFSPDAMEEIGDVNSFLERQLNDTRFISKAAMKYLKTVCKEVMASRGGLTAFLRSEMDLNQLLGMRGKKNRSDHRHHAVDAFLIGLSTPSCIKRVAKEARSQDNHLSSLINELKQSLDRMIVSHRVDHSPCSKFFQATNYGVVNDGDATLCIRREVESLSEKQRGHIVDDNIRTYVVSQTGVSSAELAKDVRARFGARRVKCIEKDASAFPVYHPTDKGPFVRWVSPISVNRLEFWKHPNDKQGKKLVCVAYNDVEVALNPSDRKRPHPAARKVLTIHKGDYLRIEERGHVRTVVVESLKPANRVILFTDHHIGKNENAKGRSISFGSLAEKKVRVVSVDELGRMKDPGAWWIDDSSRNRNRNSREQA